MSRALPLAGFQVTLSGRFWVTPEGTSPLLIESLAVRPDAGSKACSSAYARVVLKMKMPALICIVRVVLLLTKTPSLALGE
jgi:hypothetical protein